VVTNKVHGCAVAVTAGIAAATTLVVAAGGRMGTRRVQHRRHGLAGTTQRPMKAPQTDRAGWSATAAQARRRPPPRRRQVPGKGLKGSGAGASAGRDAATANEQEPARRRCPIKNDDPGNSNTSQDRRDGNAVKPHSRPRPARQGTIRPQSPGETKWKEQHSSTPSGASSPPQRPNLSPASVGHSIRTMPTQQ